MDAKYIYPKVCRFREDCSCENRILLSSQSKAAEHSRTPKPGGFWRALVNPTGFGVRLCSAALAFFAWFDRREKFFAYTSIESLEEYLLIAQHILRRRAFV